MKVDSAVFIDIGTTQHTELKRVEGSEGLETLSTMGKNDLISFLDRSMELKKYLISGKELQETSEDNFAIVFMLREVPKRD